jgi:hypothetical protein
MNKYHTLEPTQEFQSSAYNLWQPFQKTNQQILVNTGTSSNWQYRQQLQKNANNIMKYNTMASINESGNNPYTVKNTETTNKTPHLYRSVHDTSSPAYGFKNSDLKSDYMTKEKMNARMIAPTIPTNY